MFDSTDNFLTPPHISLYSHLSDILNDNFNWRRLSLFGFSSLGECFFPLLKVRVPVEKCPGISEIESGFKNLSLKIGR